MICSSEGPVQQDSTHGNVSAQSLCSDSSDGQDRNPVWTLSGTTMKAYVAMRGLPAIEDPLITWIANLEMEKRAEGEVTMLGDIENSVKERFDWKSRGPAKYDDEEAQRKSIFIFDRPMVTGFSLAHLELSEGLGTGGLDGIFRDSSFTAEGWRKYAASDVSDDGEGDPAEGRISPDTFALWSEGTRRWDEHGDKYRSAWEERKTNIIPVSEGGSLSGHPHQRLIFAKNEAPGRTPTTLFSKHGPATEDEAPPYAKPIRCRRRQEAESRMQRLRKDRAVHSVVATS